MKKQLILPILLLSSSLLSSCSSVDLIKEIKIENLDNPNLAYTSINNYYVNSNLSYIAQSDGILVSSRGTKQEIKETKIKLDQNFYSLKGSHSILLDSISMKRFHENGDGVYAVSKLNNIDSTIFTTSEITSEETYSSFILYEENEYLDKYGSLFQNITNFYIVPEHEDLSINESYIVSDTEGQAIYSYTLNNFSSYSLPNESTTSSEIDISLYSKINAAMLEEKEIASFTTLENVNISESYFTLTFDKKNNLIKSINVLEKLTISTIPFTYTYTTTFKHLSSKNELDSTFKSFVENTNSAVEKSKSQIKEDLYAFYITLNNKYKNLNYYTWTDSKVEALGGMYNQTVKGYKLKKDDEYFFQTITTSAFVNKAEERYENHLNNQYMLASGNNPNSSSIYGSVSSWNTWENYSKEDYLAQIGHEMINITNFIVDDNNPASSFLNASLNEEGNYNVYTFNMSTSETPTNIDASSEYKIEMDHMSNMGLPSFEYSNISIYIDSNEEIYKIVQQEKYKTGSFSCNSTMTTYFEIYDDFNKVPVDIRNDYNNRIGG